MFVLPVFLDLIVVTGILYVASASAGEWHEAVIRLKTEYELELSAWDSELFRKVYRVGRESRKVGSKRTVARRLGRAK